MPDLICVDPARVGEIWPHVRDKIRAAIERTGLSAFEDIEADVLSGAQLVWIAWDGKEIIAAATTKLARNVCVLVSCGGYDREKWLPMFAMIEQYAKNEGCSKMRIYGRKGWERVLDGYRAEHVILEKAL